MIMEQFPNYNELCAGVITNYDIDLLQHSISFDVKVLDNSIEKKYVLNLLGVSFFQLKHEDIPYDWDYLELTDMTVESDNDCQIVTIDLWSISEFIIICQEIKFIEVTD